MCVMATIARRVLRDAARSRLRHVIALLALGLVVAAPIAGRLSAGQDVKVVQDLGLAAINLSGLFVAVSLGIQLVGRAIERRTVDTLLSKPIRPHEFVLGQYGGLVATLALALVLMTVAMYAVLVAVTWWGGSSVFQPAPAAPAADPALLKAVILIFVQLALIAAAALCLSTFLSPALAAMFTCGLYIVGHFGPELRSLGDVVDSRLATFLGAGLSYALPALAAFDVKAAVVHAQPVTFGYMALTTASGAAYILAFLILALAIFAKRDLV